MQKTWIVGLIVAFAIGVTTLTARVQARDNENGESRLAVEVEEPLMLQKLTHAQKLLSALSVGDYKNMIVESRELQDISLEARWSQPPSRAYSEYGDDFRSALDRIVAAAENQSIDGAALNYVDLVLTCVQCHKVVREGQRSASAAETVDLESVFAQLQTSLH